MSAAGLTWQLPRLPGGQRLLSFEVGYAWQRCLPSGGHCVTAADSTATPFAAARYLVGHADTGMRLRLTETASEVVETSPATFAFTEVSRSVSALAGAVAAAYPAHVAPRTEFVNGTPEPTTASREEYFQVDAPHYNQADGRPAQRYRIDGGTWRPLPASHLLYTGHLGIGPHRVQARTANRAGVSTLSFSWRVTPMPAPVSCQPVHHACWYPPHLASDHRPMRWDWQIGRVTPLQRTGSQAVDIYDLDGFLTTAAQVHAIHTTWQAVTLPHPRTICYLDMAWEDYRPDASPSPLGMFPAATLGNVYFGYPQERWVDFRQLDALKPMLTERIKMCAREGLRRRRTRRHRQLRPAVHHRVPPHSRRRAELPGLRVQRDPPLGMTGLWKNSPYLSWWGRRYADGAIVEECYVYHACFASWLRGSTQYGITCTGLRGATPCGWDDFSTDGPAASPPASGWARPSTRADHYVCSPGSGAASKHRFSTLLPGGLRAALRLRRGQVRRRPGRQDVLPVPARDL